MCKWLIICSFIANLYQQLQIIFHPFFGRFELGGQKEDKNLLRRTKSITFVLRLSNTKNPLQWQQYKEASRPRLTIMASLK